VTESASSDPRLLRLAEGDTVMIVIAPIPAGDRFVVEGVTVEAAATLPLGFKIAARDLEEGSVAIRYGMPIGRVTRAVRCGELIHTHNLESLYMRTHARGEA
jgi:altronate dehydratase small subunit